jgi:cytochrome o ubiquinol oxidase subunit 1
VLFALFALAAQLWVSVRNRNALAVPAGDPWDGRTLEWSLPAPVPEWNFATIPEVTQRDAFWEQKRAGRIDDSPVAGYTDIPVPRNSVMGMAFAVFGALLGFALVWWIWWLAIASLLALASAVIARSFVTRTQRVIPAASIAEEDRAFRALRAAATPSGRDAECSTANRGRADAEAFA